MLHEADFQQPALDPGLASVLTFVPLRIWYHRCYISCRSDFSGVFSFSGFLFLSLAELAPSGSNVCRPTILSRFHPLARLFSTGSCKAPWTSPLVCEETAHSCPSRPCLSRKSAKLLFYWATRSSGVDAGFIHSGIVFISAAKDSKSILLSCLEENFLTGQGGFETRRKQWTARWSLTSSPTYSPLTSRSAFLVMTRFRVHAVDCSSWFRVDKLGRIKFNSAHNAGTPVLFLGHRCWFGYWISRNRRRVRVHRQRHLLVIMLVLENNIFTSVVTRHLGTVITQDSCVQV